jgi:uncharacterized protein (DUF2237 family)
MAQQTQYNVFGEAIDPCCFDPVTGFYRDGHCHTGPQDLGTHTVCAKMTDEFLRFSKAAGNDLSTPRPEFGFPGLKAGDRWCLCALRWLEAFKGDAAPRVYLRATNEKTLEMIPLSTLKPYALDLT